MDIIREISADLSNDTFLAPVYAEIRDFDKATYNHCIRIGILAPRFGHFLGFDRDGLRSLAVAGSIHDVGKCRLPQEVVLKNGYLTGEEKKIMEQHPRLMTGLLRGSDHERGVRIAMGHHEYQPRPYPRRTRKYNGNGSRMYDRGIEELGAVVALADAWDALTNGRPYKPPFPEAEAEKRLSKKFTGDPRMLREFLGMMKWYRIC